MRSFCNCINTAENIREEKKNEQMASTTYKRRSINLDDRTYKRGKLLAKSQTVSLSALLRMLINGAYGQFPGMHVVCTPFDRTGSWLR